MVAAAAALLAKVARASTSGWPEAAGIVAQAEALRDRAAPLAQLDADEYEAALESAAEEADAGDRRDYELGRAFARAAEPPLRIAEAAGDVAVLAVTVAQHGDPSLRADAVAAAALAAAAARAAGELVAVNLTTIPGDERVVRAQQLAVEAARAADEASAGD